MASPRITQDNDRRLARARAVEFNEEYALPTPQQEVLVDDGQRERRREKQGATVGVAIGRFVDRHVEASGHVVVAIDRRARYEPGKHRLEVGQKERLSFIHDEPCGGVKRLERQASNADVGGCHEPLELGREIDECDPLAGDELNAAAMRGVTDKGPCL